MMIHCRFKNPEAWAAYKEHLHQGRIFKPIGRSFRAFCGQTLIGKDRNTPLRKGPVRSHILLDDLQ